MKKPLRHWAAAAVGTAIALAFTSCTYDPYYSAMGGVYSSGYGEGYGYGGSNFSTSVFVATGDPRWGYDPTCYSYYDYQRRSYYDPYLSGYYPVGYRPQAVFGVPHPYGWSPGRGYCPPPRGVHSGLAVNYRNRDSAYRSSSYGWAHQVRQQPGHSGRSLGQYPSRSSYSNSSAGISPSVNYINSGGYSSGYRSSDRYRNDDRYSSGSRPAASSYQPQNSYRSPSYQGGNSNPRGSHDARQGSGYRQPGSDSAPRQSYSPQRPAPSPAAAPSQTAPSAAPSVPARSGGFAREPANPRNQEPSSQEQAAPAREPRRGLR